MFPVPSSNQGAATPYRVLEVHAVEGTGRTRYLLQDNDENLWHGECKKSIQSFADFLSLDENKRTRPIWLKNQSIDGGHMHLTHRELVYPKFDEKTMTRFRGDVTDDGVYMKIQKVLKTYAFAYAGEEHCSLPKALLLHEIEMCELLLRTSQKPHPNIARYFGVVTDPKDDVTAIVYQRYSVNLAEFKAAGLFHPGHAMLILIDVGKAVDRLLHLGYAHRRIVPENVLLSFDSGEAAAFRWAPSSQSVSEETNNSKANVPTPTELKIHAVVLGDLSATMKIVECPKGWNPKDAINNLYEWMIRPDANGSLWPVA